LKLFWGDEYPKLFCLSALENKRLVEWFSRNNPPSFYKIHNREKVLLKHVL
jgi:hypothetical protein